MTTRTPTRRPTTSGPRATRRRRDARRRGRRAPPRRAVPRASCCAGPGASSPRCAPRCAAAAARARRRPGLGRPAVRHRVARGRAVEGGAPRRSRRSTSGSACSRSTTRRGSAAIYLLLMVSLVGCIVPRTASTGAPSAPRRRRPRATSPGCRRTRRTARTTRPATCWRAPTAELRRRRLPGRRRPRRHGGCRAEKGHLREAGNLLFHIVVLVVLVGFAYGQLFGYKGGAIVMVGQRLLQLAHAVRRVRPGGLFDAGRPAAGELHRRRLRRRVPRPRAAKRGSRRLRRRPHLPRDAEARPRSYDLQVNKPLTVDGIEVFLVGHGYAPVVTVRDGDGDVAYCGPVVFLPQDATFASFGVVKVPDAEPEQLGFEGCSSRPTPSRWTRAVLGLPRRAQPGDLAARLPRRPRAGRRGPQSVYALDTDETEQFEKPDGTPFRVDLRPGKTVELPDGLGSVSFDGWSAGSSSRSARPPARRRPRRRRPGAARAAGLAVHPPAPGLGAGARRDGRAHWSRSPGSTASGGRRRAPRELADSVAAALGRARPAAEREERDVTDAACATFSNQADRGRGHRLRPRPAGAPGRVGRCAA